MKKLIVILCMSIMAFPGCKKDKDGPEDEKKSENQLTALVPEAYLNEARALGFNIYEGNNPPIVAGEYLLAPWRFDGDNYSEPGTGTPVGYTVEKGLTIQLSEQDGADIKVALIGYYEGFKLSEPFIMGSGNNFTICQHVNMTGGMGGLFNFPYARLISGTKDGDVLKNVKMATIGLELDKPNDGGITVHGQVSLWSDADGESR